MKLYQRLIKLLKKHKLMLIGLVLGGLIINLSGQDIIITSDDFSVDSTGNMFARSGEIGGFNITEEELNSNIFSDYNFTEEDLTKIQGYIMGTVTLTEEELSLYDVYKDGKVDSRDYMMVKNYIASGITKELPGKVIWNNGDVFNTFVIKDGLGNDLINLNAFESYIDNLKVGTLEAEEDITDLFSFNGEYTGKIYKIGKIIHMQIYVTPYSTANWFKIATIPEEFYPVEVYDGGTPIQGTECWAYASGNREGGIYGKAEANTPISLCGTYVIL